MVTVPSPDAPASASSPSRREQSRARYPDETGFIERDGVRVFWDRYRALRDETGNGRTILLMPTWSIVHSRRWKFQIPFLARHWNVVAFDGRGNGRSDRPADEAAYADTEFVADAVGVLDAIGVERAVVVGLSMGGGWGLRLAAEHPDRVEALILEGAAVAIADPVPGKRNPPADEALDEYEGWGKYNFHYWRQNYPDFAAFFFGECLSEPHSTKGTEDCIGWALETDPETLILTDTAPYLSSAPSDPEASEPHVIARAFAARVRCPSLVIHGTDDHIVSFRHGEYLATALGARFQPIGGGGHLPGNRDPVRYNLLLRDFIRSLPGGSR
ncbi:MAG TPA: alpha/beta hydrolase [Candidatus Limnocylindrales bacterium]|nr:alpha/beta hydrolase [Candidatus Limnocylindrales bacterium]